MSLHRSPRFVCCSHCCLSIYEGAGNSSASTVGVHQSNAMTAGRRPGRPFVFAQSEPPPPGRPLPALPVLEFVCAPLSLQCVCARLSAVHLQTAALRVQLPQQRCNEGAFAGAHHPNHHHQLPFDCLQGDAVKGRRNALSFPCKGSRLGFNGWLPRLGCFIS